MAALTIAVALMGFGLAAAPAQAAAPFDGDWITTVSCPDNSGAMGYSFEVPTAIRDGVLHGERMHAGEPGWLVLDGQVAPDGKANLYAKGLVGAAPFAVGKRPTGSPYGYHVTARFDGARGNGARVEGRPCSLTFVRQ